ncbi:flagellar assembly protein FliW [Clostridia bacterium]|nr:flagellar assembly protein FliW [Clostridia bacterium]
MVIGTKYFGEIDVEESEIIIFPFGLYGFESFNRFILIRDDESDTPADIFMWLQSADDADLCFVVMDPTAIVPDYSPALPDGTAHKLDAGSDSVLRYLAITVIHDDIESSTVNLLSPIVINSATHIASQVILEQSDPRNSGFIPKQRIFVAASVPDGYGTAPESPEVV